MAIQTLDNLLTAIQGGSRNTLTKVSVTSEGAGTYHSMLKVAGLPTAFGPNPTTVNGDIPTNTTTYSLNLPTISGGNKCYLSNFVAQSTVAGSLILYDRLWHNSGLVGNVATAQTFTTPTLTRYSDGVGVEIWLEFYSAIGATATTFTVTYVDADGVTRTCTYAHPANAETVGQMITFVMPTGSRGVKSISQIQLAATTGTAGNFGLVLMKRIATLPITIPNVATNLDAFGLGMPEIQPNACLCTMLACTTTTTGNILGEITLVQG